MCVCFESAQYQDFNRRAISVRPFFDTLFLHALSQICRCRASCMDHLNETHAEGTTWHPNSCTTCICEPGGRLNCKETICSVACSNPLPPKPGTCCPVCPITVSFARNRISMYFNKPPLLPFFEKKKKNYLLHVFLRR